MLLTEYLAQLLRQAIAQGVANQTLGQLRDPEQIPGLSIPVAIPNDLSFGDYASPVALGLAKLCRLPPLKIAQTIAAGIPEGAGVEVTVAGAGYINFRLQPLFLEGALQGLLQAGDDYGRSQVAEPEKILLEYVSANPTGPLHLGHGRWAAVGSTLANLLRWVGHQVDREFYINDAGNQMAILGQSLQIRVRQLRGEKVELPADAYHGSYLIDLAQKAIAAGVDFDSPAAWADYAYEAMLAWQKQTLLTFQTEFEQWFSERRLHQPDPETGLSAISLALEELKAKGLIYEATAARQEIPREDAEPALYFATSKFGDDKDRVVAKADGTTTYLAADIAYHRDKVQRGYQRLINILGSDHHGYIGRLHAAVKAFNADVNLEILIGQFVKLFKRDPETGEKTEVRMSKRSGNFVSLNDLIEDPEFGVGVDAARWFLISSSMDSPINFDLDLAVSQSEDNPVFYVQYAHTRCCSLLRRAQEAGMGVESLAPITREGQLVFSEPEERLLLLALLELPDEIAQAARERAPHRICRYAERLARLFSRFYDACRIVALLNDQPQLAYARLQLVKATRQSLKNLLTGILKISAPTSM
ncbi:MAG: arginine--tRNA ligase [Thermostichales cyanobacterium BF4_bins_65]